MAKTGWEFGADLSQLQLISKVELPLLAYTYAQLNRNIAATREKDRDAFVPPGAAAGMDVVGGPWTTLRNELQRLLAGTATCLETCAATVQHIVDTYAATDAAAAASLASGWSGGPPGVPAGQLPPGPPPSVIAG
jgi:hypothetical protein